MSWRAIPFARAAGRELLGAGSPPDGPLKIARSLPHAALLARELVNFRFKVGGNGPEDALDWREGPDDDLVLALAIPAWEAERARALASSLDHGPSGDGGMASLLALGLEGFDRGRSRRPHEIGASPLKPLSSRDVGPRGAKRRGEFIGVRYLSQGPCRAKKRRQTNCRRSW